MNSLIGCDMHFEISLARQVAQSFPAAVALREANVAFAWDESAAGADAESRPVRIRAGAASESLAGEHRLDCASLLGLVQATRAPGPAGGEPLRQAIERTHIHTALGLLRSLSAHTLGDPVVPITLKIRGGLAGLEAAIAGPLFVPQRFVYVPALYFWGEEFSMVDAAFAGVFRVAERLGEHFWQSLAFDFPKMCAWKEALSVRPTVRETSSDLAV